MMIYLIKLLFWCERMGYDFKCLNTYLSPYNIAKILLFVYFKVNFKHFIKLNLISQY